MPLRPKRVFTLTVPSTASIDAPGGATARLRYNVNWDTLFKDFNYKYETCRVRFHLVTNNTTATSIGNSTGSITILGLGQVGGQVVNQGTSNIYNQGAVLGTIAPSNSSASGGISTGYFYDVSTTNSTNGVEVVMPTGFQTITVQFTGESFNATGDAYVSDYLLILHFELTDPME